MKKINIAVVGLGQIGIYLYNELQRKKKILSLKQERKLILLQFQLKTKVKKENLKLIKKFFFLTPSIYLKKRMLTYYLNVLV